MPKPERKEVFFLLLLLLLFLKEKRNLTKFPTPFTCWPSRSTGVSCSLTRKTWDTYTISLFFAFSHSTSCCDTLQIQSGAHSPQSIISFDRSPFVQQFAFRHSNGRRLLRFTSSPIGGGLLLNGSIITTGSSSEGACIYGVRERSEGYTRRSRWGGFFSFFEQKYIKRERKQKEKFRLFFSLYTRTSLGIKSRKALQTQ